MIAGSNGVVQPETPRTVLDFLRRATVFLAQHEVATPRLDAEVLLAFLLDAKRVDVYLRFDQPLGEAEVVAYRELVRRRGAGEPVAYLTGRREFWSRDVQVTPDVLIPRPETELLVERALADIGDRTRALRVLDLGTGSGALALALATELPGAQVVALDVSPAAVAVARGNIESAGLADRVEVAISDWTASIDGGPCFDLIVCNPPYVETAVLGTLAAEVRQEPALALDGGPDGLVAYRALVPLAMPLLASGGRMLLEIGEGQAEPVAALLGAAGSREVARYRDLAGIERVVGGYA